MRGLLLKEYYTMIQSPVVILAIVGFILSILFGAIGTGALLCYAIVVAICWAIFSTEEERWYRIIMVSPIGWKKMIFSKYIFCLFVCVAVTASWFLCSILRYVYTGEGLYYMINLALLILSELLICISIFIPSAYYWGSERASSILTIIYLLMIIVNIQFNWLQEIETMGSILLFVSTAAIILYLLSLRCTFIVIGKNHGKIKWRITR